MRPNYWPTLGFRRHSFGTLSWLPPVADATGSLVLTQVRLLAEQAVVGKNQFMPLWSAGSLGSQ